MKKVKHGDGFGREKVVHVDPSDAQKVCKNTTFGSKVVFLHNFHPKVVILHNCLLLLQE